MIISICSIDNKEKYTIKNGLSVLVINDKIKIIDKRGMLYTLDVDKYVVNVLSC